MSDDRRIEERRKMDYCVALDRRKQEERRIATAEALMASRRIDVMEDHVAHSRHAPGVLLQLSNAVDKIARLEEENRRLRRIIDAAQLNDTKGCASFHADGRCVVS